MTRGTVGTIACVYSGSSNIEQSDSKALLLKKRRPGAERNGDAQLAAAFPNSPNRPGREHHQTECGEERKSSFHPGAECDRDRSD